MRIEPVVVYVVVVAVLGAIFVLTTYQTRFRLADDRLEGVGITPETTLSRFHRHFYAGLFHTNPAHILFNLGVFSLGFWFATRQRSPAETVGGAYVIGILVVLLVHLFVVLPGALVGWGYARNALDGPLVGFSVIAYATLGMAMVQAPSWLTWVGVAAVLVFEIAAGILVTGPFISVYHLVGFGAGYYVRWILTHSTRWSA